jgi:hypothetical protein
VKKPAEHIAKNPARRLGDRRRVSDFAAGGGNLTVGSFFRLPGAQVLQPSRPTVDCQGREVGWRRSRSKV